MKSSGARKRLKSPCPKSSGALNAFSRFLLSCLSSTESSMYQLSGCLERRKRTESTIPKVVSHLRSDLLAQNSRSINYRTMPSQMIYPAPKHALQQLRVRKQLKITLLNDPDRKEVRSGDAHSPTLINFHLLTDELAEGYGPTIMRTIAAPGKKMAPAV